MKHRVVALPQHSAAACVRLRLREQTRRDACRIARWQLRAEIALLATVALWVGVEAIVGALARVPA